MSQKEKDLSLRKKLTFSSILVITFFVVAEILARVVIPPADYLLRQEQQQLIQILGLPDLNKIMEFDYDVFWILKKESHDLHISGTIGEYNIGFTVNIHNRLRSPLVSQLKTKLRILTLGDSCTFGVGVNDEETWPAQLQKLFDETGIPVEVINAGVPGYTAFQGKLFLEKFGLKMQPDLVIASFGFNDRDTWASRSDTETFHELISKRWERVVIYSRFYYGLKLLFKGFMSWQDQEKFSGEQEKSLKNRQNTSARPRLSEEEFYEALIVIKTLCAKNNIALAFLVWPYRRQVTEKLRELVFYQQITAYVCQQEKLVLFNLVEPFINTNKELFIDQIHANKEGCRIVAETLYREIAPRLSPK